mgnify:CR=1 FL=1
MEKQKLIHTKHYTNSVIEVYLSEDKTKVYQVKCLTRNRCKKYVFDTETNDYFFMEMNTR